MSGKETDLNSSEFPTPLVGTVLAVQANFYQVRLASILEDDATTTRFSKSGGSQSNQDNQNLNLKTQTLKLQTLLCTRRSRLKKIGQRVMVGDRVLIEEPDWAGGRGAIADVLPRQSQLDRPAIANVEQMIVFFAIAEPTLDPYQLSRFLVKAESTGLKVGLCLNKSDLVTTQQIEDWQKRLEKWGYQPIFISVYNRTGLKEFSEQLNHKITVLAGLSGVGKSSLINQMAPENNLRVGEVTGKLGRGRHTTRHVELFEFAKGSLVADTPGFNQPEFNCNPGDLVNYFPEARQRLAEGNCQFHNCLHQDEPNCAVRGDWERYQHYLDFLADAIAHQERLNDRAAPESTLKAKNKGKGQTQYEPKLQTKKYRRTSRRTQHQELDGLYDEE
ncbi:MAG TPA: ribosome small subunit-dependent GTPase A [Cyanobacteria bacterium UBA11149]|nr:ribosome small subunit-dependent GTPase A [Cyanobacteria bacterium UBA11367]HBE60442.1 ribosome small subunit-dependent GTPase A [Cyanobacteria bacterium UBA11366]HBK62035.1 ribosome small subunit-dependent GTPase A [Cyanobacteria bacterium UBA11166]HBR76989.1 ribosome small subunit-dependent GTPase A [Cyanobacteria bacterium UBA11159]HBS67617.1 ribosome small subunit-dependent GTPase A [Cyanobacteria bacterium UBA11153]HBW90010.1 ribosome small subunit-dependent GTPase A [Cyanobacteria bac